MDKIGALKNLILAEGMLDRYRGLVPAGTVSRFPEEKKKIEEELDTLRGFIREKLDGLSEEHIDELFRTLQNDMMTWKR